MRHKLIANNNVLTRSSRTTKHAEVVKTNRSQDKKGRGDQQSLPENSARRCIELQDRGTHSSLYNFSLPPIFASFIGQDYILFKQTLHQQVLLLCCISGALLEKQCIKYRIQAKNILSRGATKTFNSSCKFSLFHQVLKRSITKIPYLLAQCPNSQIEEIKQPYLFSLLDKPHPSNV